MVYLGPYLPEEFEIEEMFAQLSLAKSIVNYDGTNVVIGDMIPSESIIVGLVVNVDTPWDVPALMTLGSNSDSDAYAGADAVNLNQAGLYLIDVFAETLGSSSINAYVSSSGASAGKASVFAILRVGAA